MSALEIQGDPMRILTALLLMIALLGCAAKPGERYAKAQQLYAAEKYRRADDLFKSLEHDSEFAFRASAMRAMIAYFMQSPDASLAKFISLKKSYPPSTPHYEFVLLSIARVLVLENRDAAALDAYCDADEFQHGRLDASTRMEIAQLSDRFLRVTLEERSSTVMSDNRPETSAGYERRRNLLMRVSDCLPATEAAGLRQLLPDPR
jgi:hypothetical protein